MNETNGTKQEKVKLAEKQEMIPKSKIKKSSVGAAWTFPKNPLEDAINIAKAIEEQNAGNPMKADQLVKAVGYNKSNDWRFLDLLRSANQYGLVLGSGAAATVSIESIGQDIIAPGSPKDRQEALGKAFRNVEEFKKVEEFYKGKKLPEDEFFENTLVREFSIPRDRVKIFKAVFTKNLEYLREFRGEHAQPDEKRQMEPASSGVIGTKPAGEGRQFLDSCFVMMPYGQWFDAYYKEIFIPAIKDAGMEPVRADELFSTGTVIEQIWEQIKKAKILLADLSGKNANVFYEMGLAHAQGKAVVFTAASLDDVPFDLRHLRVVIYDIKDPSWGAKLQANLSSYLKAAKEEPAKSVPQPFRFDSSAAKAAAGG
ncbi:MAG: hypothetical protein KGO96_02850 [Elusimicrobia bacterium]|nr:hypothetical protein [Elusimicrobiota bacterium]MDE2424832.1 hypothetical protein [Elusimicrobiota bacterium]